MLLAGAIGGAIGGALIMVCIGVAIYSAKVGQAQPSAATVYHRNNVPSFEMRTVGIGNPLRNPTV